jgi:hypothetical protein
VPGANVDVVQPPPLRRSDVWVVCVCVCAELVFAKGRFNRRCWVARAGSLGGALMVILAVLEEPLSIAWVV